MSPFSIGNLVVDRVEEICKPAVPPLHFLRGLPENALDTHRAWLEPGFLDPASGLLPLSIHSWLVRTSQHVVLIDTCSGNHKSRPGFPPAHNLSLPYLERLAEKGLRPEDIDYVMCTHLHLDHVGWNTRLQDGRWVPTFPKARYLFSRTEYNAFNPATGPGDPNPVNTGTFEDSVLPIAEAGQMQLVDDGYSVDDELTVESAVGHSEGHVVIRAKSGDDEGVFLGDVLHSPLQCCYPDVNTAFCQHPESARQTRRRLLSEAAERGQLLMPAHFPAPHVGRVSIEGEGFRFHPGVARLPRDHQA
jgi:glyoxylase-like metal-dependent hydrolase (beta-lactamase superfamily II)